MAKKESHECEVATIQPGMDATASDVSPPELWSRKPMASTFCIKEPGGYQTLAETAFAHDDDVAQPEVRFSVAKDSISLVCRQTPRLGVFVAIVAIIAAVFVFLAVGPKAMVRTTFHDKEGFLIAAEADVPRFQRIRTGTCVGNGLFPIVDQTVCEAAARSIGLADSNAEATMKLNRPQGCYWYSYEDEAAFDKHRNGLWYSFNPGAAGKGAETSDPTSHQLRYPVCTTQANCGLIEEGVIYPGSRYGTILNIPTAGLCCQKCQADWKCGAWTWDKPAQVCNLLGHEHDFAAPVGTPQGNMVSGLPHRSDKSPGTLHCVALLQPGSYEIGLLQMQHHLKVGIFACDEFAVYSNVLMELAPGIRTGVINSDLKCKLGGDAGTALNTGIFIEFWKRVISDGRFRFNEWTVKVDVDAVFFPERLRGVLREHHDGDNGVYLNNCKYGLHGPIEVFSRKAVETYAMNYRKCQKKLWFAATHWGEDMYMDQCLQKVLNVQRDNQWSLICEDHCDCPEYKACNTGAVVFHPFKTEAEYRQCMLSAGAIVPA